VNMHCACTRRRAMAARNGNEQAVGSPEKKLAMVLYCSVACVAHDMATTWKIIDVYNYIDLSHP